MAVTTVGHIYKLTAANDEIARSLRVHAVRWVSDQATAGDQLLLVESSAGTTTKELWESYAAGANYVEESAALAAARLPHGLRISVIDSGELWVYASEA